ncbi:unnamed protein product [Victoria cruziana]
MLSGVVLETTKAPVFVALKNMFLVRTVFGKIGGKQSPRPASRAANQQRGPQRPIGHHRASSYFVFLLAPRVIEQVRVVDDECHRRRSSSFLHSSTIVSRLLLPPFCGNVQNWTFGFLVPFLPRSKDNLAPKERTKEKEATSSPRNTEKGVICWSAAFPACVGT